MLRPDRKVKVRYLKHLSISNLSDKAWFWTEKKLNSASLPSPLW